MTRDEVAEHLRSLTYLPEWGFEVHVGQDALFNGMLYGRSVGPDDVLFIPYFTAPESADAPGEETTIELARPLVVATQYVSGVEELEGLVLVHLARVQLHELGELVKFGGHAPFHPHREDGRERMAEVQATLDRLDMSLVS